MKTSQTASGKTALHPAACLVLAAAGSCSLAPQPEKTTIIPRLAERAGCYRVALGPWTETGQHKGFVPPGEFRLDTALSTSTLTDYYARLAHPAPVRTALPEIQGRHLSEPGVWYDVGQDSIRVEWYNRAIRGGYHFLVRGDSVVGVATTWSHFRVLGPGMKAEDVIDPTAQARGVRVPCGS